MQPEKLPSSRKRLQGITAVDKRVAHSEALGGPRKRSTSHDEHGASHRAKVAAKASKELEKPSYVAMDFKLSTLRDLLIGELEANDGFKAKAVVNALVNKAMEGDTYCLRLLLERVDGLMTKNVNLTGAVAVGQVVTLIDTRSLDVQLPITDRASSLELREVAVETKGSTSLPSPLTLSSLENLERESEKESLRAEGSTFSQPPKTALASEAAIEQLGNSQGASSSKAGVE